VYNAFVLSILAGGILLMVLPSELLAFKPAEVGGETGSDKPDLHLAWFAR
jgi:3-dehydroquinate synthetase